MIGLFPVYLLAGAVFGAIAVLSALDHANPKRWANAAFWGLDTGARATRTWLSAARSRSATETSCSSPRLRFRR
jgi:hypothetical protein